MIYSFKIEEHKTIAVDKPASGTWVNVLPPLKQGVGYTPGFSKRFT
jgi:hypothetical protein